MMRGEIFFELLLKGCGRVRGFMKPEPLAETLDKSRATYSDFQTEEETDSSITPRSDTMEEPPTSEASDAGTEEGRKMASLTGGNMAGIFYLFS